MVAVDSPDRPSKSLLRKAAVLARARGLGIELVHVISLPYVPAVKMRATLRQAARAIMEDRRDRMLKLAGSRYFRGLQTRASVCWDYPAADGLVRHVMKRRAALLLAESQRHMRIVRPFLSNTDWELIRKCPCPLWLSKSARTTIDRTIVAAVDPLHAHAKPAALDDSILRQALEAANGHPSRVLAVHASRPPQPEAVEAYWIGRSERELQQYEAQLRGAIERLAKRYRIPDRNVLIVSGDPAYALPRIASTRRAGLLVMGAVSRSALARLFIGHTAERVIDALQTDVLIVKPRGFRTTVSPRLRSFAGLLPLPPSRESYHVARTRGRHQDRSGVRASALA
jgi:universal stress protein E